jgi:hypothetical protein
LGHPLAVWQVSPKGHAGPLLKSHGVLESLLLLGVCLHFPASCGCVEQLSESFEERVPQFQGLAHWLSSTPIRSASGPTVKTLLAAETLPRK